MTSDQVKKFQYTALVVRQQPGAPDMYLASIPAASLLEWADVPSAKADYMAGYQRVYNPIRAKEIKDFLENDVNNITPGAIVVAVDGAAVDVQNTSVDGVLEVTVSVTDDSFEERLARHRESFFSRLSAAEVENVEALTGAAQSDNAEAESDVDDAGIPDSYIAALTAELATACNDFDSLPIKRRDAIKQYIDSVSKPGLIIDGQHRVFGAKDVSMHDVNLPVVLLPGLGTAEQVFHFYVLNNKAKPLSPTELRRTVSTSLTNQEIDNLWKRFEDSGVNPEATRWTHKMNTDPKSPFRNLIDFGLGGDGFIKENVAYQVISKFVNMPRKYRTLQEGVPAWEEASEERLDYFFAFWSAIKERYSEVWKSGVQSQGNQLFLKAAMLVLQEFLLDFFVSVKSVRDMEGKPSPIADMEEMSSLVVAALKFIPPDFFTLEWQEKQLDTSERRTFLLQQMEMSKRNQGKFLGNQQLFKKS
ncbi:hypothetical protein ACFW6C_09865 [Streptomyces fungicidicus]|uniref:hypothetical protein n=1 Tax=Streptomyces fungicidicus TaxID=68203 RepID=UPI0033330008